MITTEQINDAKSLTIEIANKHINAAMQLRANKDNLSAYEEKQLKIHDCTIAFLLKIIKQLTTNE
jgi:hypothetical protein